MMQSFLLLLIVHWLGDFVLQSHWQASNKSKNLWALALHVEIYTMVLLAGTVMILGSDRNQGIFVLVNGLLHFGTDYITSRLSARLWAKQDWHNFFVVIGLDQLIHQMTLGITMLLIIGGNA